ncbi:Alpha/beta hydrolase fold-1 [Microdochium bolleyi]|uniref:Alpha/beta hydrolase fold-1 n=1 Tax=Microdochium bolleyi TaxID=196109 RepID=A0A136IV47_9PEZI|nr:Alpha/beta hydrolase fold-1 [Microdochium bolleyi]
MSPTSVLPPAILFVHGAYHPPAVYAALTSALRNAGPDVVAPCLASLGNATHDVRVPDDDVAVVRGAADELFAHGRKVVVLAHSIGGFFATVAIKGHTVTDRAREGKEGGFAAVVYMNSTLPVGREDTVMSVCDPASAGAFDIDAREDGKITNNGCVGQMVGFFKTDPESKELAFHMFYSCVPRQLAEQTFASLEGFCTATMLTPAPVVVSDLEGFPRTYIVGEQDYIVPLAQQERIIENAPGMKAVRLQDCGHSPFLTHVDKVVEIVQEVATKAS